MENKQLAKWGFVHSLGVVVYTLLVALVMQYGDHLFGKTDTIFSVSIFLTLLILSVAVVGSLIVGKPIMLYLDGKKKEAVKLLGYTVLFLFIFLVIGLVKMAIFK